MPSPEKLPRPPWWRPEPVLERVRGGKNVKEVIEEALAELAAADLPLPSERTLRNDIHDWRRLEPGFHLAWNAALEACYAQRDEKMRSGGKGGQPPKFTVEAKEAFLEEMEANGGELTLAARAVGISPGHVLAVLNERSPYYDAEFRERFIIAEGERLAPVYDAYFEEALTLRGRDDPQRNSLVLTRLGESRLAHLLNPKKQIEVEARHTHTHELAPAAMRQIAQMGKLFLPPAPKEEGEVIDVTPVRELVEVER